MCPIATPVSLLLALASPRATEVAAPAIHTVVAPAHLQDAAAPAQDSTAPADAGAAAAPPEPPRWKGNVSLGLTVSTGNTELTTGAMDFSAERKSEVDRFTVKSYWNYAEQENALGEDELTQRRAGGSLKYDYFINPSHYALGMTSADTDETADLDMRSTFGVGYGWQRLAEEKLSHGLEIGLSYVDENYEVAEDQSYYAARGASNLSWEFRKGLHLDQVSELYQGLESWDDVFAKADTKLRANLTETMYAQFAWALTYDNTPAAGKERLDNVYTLTLGWSF